MIVENPPIYPEVRVTAQFTQNPEFNRRELDACVQKALELNGRVHIPAGVWPLSPICGDTDQSNSGDEP